MSAVDQKNLNRNAEAAQFLELVSCPMSQEEYLEILKDQGRF